MMIIFGRRIIILGRMMIILGRRRMILGGRRIISGRRRKIFVRIIVDKIKVSKKYLPMELWGPNEGRLVARRMTMQGI